MSDGPVCWKCMRLDVVDPGELCRMCLEGWEPPYRSGPRVKPLDEWSLEELVATQEAGDVPGQRAWMDAEIPVADIADMQYR